MPRDANSMPICGPSKNECVKEALETVEKASYDSNGPVSECNCLQSCTDMDFPTSLTTSRLSKAKLLKVSNEVKAKVPSITNDEFVTKNIAILHIYHNQLHFLKHERGQVRNYYPNLFVILVKVKDW